MCICMSLDRVLVRLGLKGGGYSLMKQAENVVAAYCLGVCPRVAMCCPIRELGWTRCVVTVVQYWDRRAVGACPFGNYPIVVQFLYACCSCWYPTDRGYTWRWESLRRASLVSHCTTGATTVGALYFLSCRPLYSESQAT